MRTIAWLSLGLIACACGGRVVGVTNADVGVGVDAAPPQRGPTDGALAPDVRPSPTDVFASDPLVRPDLAVAIDAQPDRATVVDTGVDLPIVVVDAAPDLIVGRMCQVANPNACPAGSYCLSANCVTGNCVVAPPSDQAVPVCGCDRITYWNAAVAAAAAPGVRVAGACPNGVVCGGVAGLNCQNGTFCNLQVANAAACNVADTAGRCWALPDVCPPQLGFGPTNRRCAGNNLCMSTCDMIRNERVYFSDPTCPQ